MTFRFIGKSLPRTEDLRLVRGLGRYTADLAPSDALRLHILRSPHAAARIRAIDTAAAKAMPGVQLILTGDDQVVKTFPSRTTDPAEWVAFLKSGLS